MENEKTEFTAQHYFLKWLAALPAVTIAVLLQIIVTRLITHRGFLFFLLFAAIFAGILSAYYKFTDYYELFLFKGYFSVQEDTVVIELGKKRYEIKDVTQLIFNDIKVFPSEYPYISITTESTFLKITGGPQKNGSKFADSDIAPLVDAILKTNKDLEPKTLLNEQTRGWYEKKRK